ncbi:MAG: PIN domain-containing protein [Lachnospiraceae bacterium]|nr:PIN domain-containing protein [Lachnospiraceae bacterium]
MLKLLDANVILRYLLDDIKEQADLAENAIKEGAFSIPEVIAEVVYVLDGVYKIKRTDIRDVLTNLMGEISITEKEVILKALKLYEEYNLDYVDCILIARSELYDEKVLSFDKKLNKYLK